ncbi:proprotein convertase subtilisin/kexin type 4-like isoform X2 [Corticium candelabrum]|uniref:proprotein convertase subtilisin/kexin type 4-like isoform X2 n=1 Tax=Corticium candelabrum TaxID=121492 RepID=UPI002E275006|nr:proprotein convertase subtilisin/kexin type 4-like isoform X2 [Corticium candelabrum]
MFLQIVFSFSGILAAVPLYTNDWAVEVSHPGVNPNMVAARHGHDNLGRVGSMDNIYHFRHPSVLKQSTGNAHYHTARLQADSEVRWAEQQRVKTRVKRKFRTPTDPLWGDEWYLNSGMDHNVLPVWKQGVTGKGVVLSVVDDGIQYSHPDLFKNYDPIASSTNSMLDVQSYTSEYVIACVFSNLLCIAKIEIMRFSHGTACAGEISAGRNSRCGVGVAYEARVGGIQVLEQHDVSHLASINEAAALSFRSQYIDIYTSSWGPADDGKTVDGPTWATRKGIENGILKGRYGLGSIYVWAAGNGGYVDDDCNCDNYAGSIHTISVSAATNLGKHAWYSEKCTSTLTTAFSNGGTKGVITTSLNGSCTSDFGGTSAAAPLVAGIIALSLQVNPRLNWRDVQHVIVRASRVIDQSDSLWVTNGAGFHVNPKYGFGILDAQKAVELAKQWTSVPDQHICYARSYTHPRNVTENGLVLTMTTDGCCHGNNDVIYLEHVVSRIDLQSTYRGDLSIHLVSPKGTHSQLLHPRPADTEGGRFSNWPFMSTHYWGENPMGTWKLEVKKHESQTDAKLNDWVLLLYGTKYPPVMQSNQSKNDDNQSNKSTISMAGADKDTYVRLQAIHPRNRKRLPTLDNQTPTEAAVVQPTVHHPAAIALLAIATTVVTLLIVCLTVVLCKRREAESTMDPNKKEDRFQFESSQLQFEEETLMSD